MFMTHYEYVMDELIDCYRHDIHIKVVQKELEKLGASHW